MTYGNPLSYAPIAYAKQKLVFNAKKEPIDYTFIEVNEAFEKFTGLKRDEIIGKRVTVILPDVIKSSLNWIEPFANAAITGQSQTFEQYASPLQKWYKVFIHSHDYGFFETFYVDITEYMNDKRRLERINKRYENLAQNSRSIAFELDLEGKYTYINSVVHSLLGYHADEIIGKKYFYDLAEGKNQEELKKYGMDVLRQEKSITDYEQILTTKDGKNIWVTTNGEPLYNENNEYIGFLGIDIDITHIKKTEQEILFLSYHDQLTELYNRRFFEEELKRLDTQRNLPFSIIMIDVNGLKLTNDAFGHHAGDELLIRLAESLKNTFRADDIICRIGGDEFVILLPKTPFNDAKKLENRLLDTVKGQEVYHLPVSISSGVATKEKTLSKMEDIFKHAEVQMYKIKTSQRKSNRNHAIKKITELLFSEVEEEKMHAERVSEVSGLIGRALRLKEEQVNTLIISGLLHDIGKISIPNEILQKKKELTQDDWLQIKRHPEISYIILSSSSEYIGFAEEVLYHHERYDGMGYPKGLKGEEIPLLSRIITLADAFVGMTSPRPYREAIPLHRVLQIITEEKGMQFDPHIVDVFIKSQVYLRASLSDHQE